MRILVLEDEAAVARRLVRLLRDLLGTRLESIDTVDHLEAARRHLLHHPVDLLVLDLEVYEEDGFQLLDPDLRSAVLVVSAHADRAIEAFDHGVIDFVAKPASRERLALALERFEQRRITPRPRRLAVRRGGEVISLDLDQVVFIQGAGDYSEVHLQSGHRFLHDRSLTDLAATLSAPFVRVHRSYLVDFRRVRRLASAAGSRYRLLLDDGREVPVGRSRLADLRRLLGMAAD